MKTGHPSASELISSRHADGILSFGSAQLPLVVFGVAVDVVFDCELIVENILVKGVFDVGEVFLSDFFDG